MKAKCIIFFSTFLLLTGILSGCMKTDDHMGGRVDRYSMTNNEQFIYIQ